MSVPAPILWPPSGEWVGIDGQWSSFALRTGTPGQLSHVLPSSAVFTTWVVGPFGCDPSVIKHIARDCPVDRGGIYNHAGSSTWHEVGNYSTVVEGYLTPNYSVRATFGHDTVSLDAGNATAGPTLQAQVVGAIAANTFYNGVFGLNHQPSNFTTLNDPQPSFLSSLKSQNLIPSLSWGYTAGASYRNALGSLTLGGYDASQFEPNNVSFTLSGDTTFDLMVGLRSIRSTKSNGTALSFLSSPLLAFIDTTLPITYLPPDACRLFEQTFNLQWDEKFGLYHIHPDAHASNTARNANITFTLGDTTTGGATVDIVLPYASFELTATFPLVPQTAQYFPLRRAHNASQVTLGRAFFQEAYLIADYEHSSFSISQAKTSNTTPPNLVAISAASFTGNPPLAPIATPTPIDAATKSNGLSQEAKAGIIAGITAVIAISFFVLAIFLLRWRSASRRRKQSVEKLQIQYTFPKHELDGTAFVRPTMYSPDEKLCMDKELASAGFIRPRTHSMDKKAELMNYEIVELPDDPIVHEIMSRPEKTWNPKGRRAGHKTTYAAYVNVKKARENRMSNGKVSPPISKFCRISCAPIREKLVNLNRSLPPTPVWLSPRASRLSAPLPNSRRVPRTPVQNFMNK